MMLIPLCHAANDPAHGAPESSGRAVGRSGDRRLALSGGSERGTQDKHGSILERRSASQFDGCSYLRRVDSTHRIGMWSIIPP
jgi:hypothetical protein